MSTRDAEMLRNTMGHTLDTLREFARQIDAGDYSTREAVADFSATFGAVYVGELHQWVTRQGWADELEDGFDASDEFALDDLESVLSEHELVAEGGVVYRVTDNDDPTTLDGTSIHDYGLEFVAEIGTPYTFILSSGGPHIEIQRVGEATPTLEGWWGTEHVTLHDSDTLGSVMDYMLSYCRPF